MTQRTDAIAQPAASTRKQTVTCLCLSALMSTPWPTLLARIQDELMSLPPKARGPYARENLSDEPLQEVRFAWKQ